MNFTINDQTYVELPVTAEQAGDCAAILTEWAPANGIDCMQL